MGLAGDSGHSHVAWIACKCSIGVAAAWFMSPGRRVARAKRQRAPEHGHLRLRISPFRWNRIGNERQLRVAIKPRRTRPRPFTRPFHQTLSHGVEMDVGDHGHQGLWLDDVAVVSTSRLPEMTLRAIATILRDLW